MTNTVPLAANLRDAWPQLRFVKSVSSREWHSECPNCGDVGHEGKDWPDRFVMRYDGERSRGWCRRCGYAQFAVNVVRDGQLPKWSKDELDEFRRQREREENERAAELQQRLKQFTTAELWSELNRRMTEENRNWWLKRGIPNDWQDFWKLGYRADKQAYSIPYFDPSSNPVTIQYRLVNPPEPNDKYRWEYGLHSAPYITRPDMGLSGSVIICEGAIKAMVTFIYGAQAKMQVLAVPSKADFAGIESLVEKSKAVFIMLDPDARDRAQELGENIGRRSRIVELPGKVDDLILRYGLRQHELRMALRYARPI